MVDKADFHAYVWELWDRVCAGSEEAAREFVARLQPVLKYHIRRFLHQAVRRFVDSSQLAQDALTELWQEAARGRVWERPEDLVGFGIRLAQHTTQKANRPYECRKRQGDLHANSLEGLKRHEPTSAAPDPLAVALAQDEWERLLRTASETHPQDAEEIRKILELRRDGWSYEEIAHALGHNERTIRKIVEIIGSRWRTGSQDM